MNLIHGEFERLQGYMVVEAARRGFACSAVHERALMKETRTILARKNKECAGMSAVTTTAVTTEAVAKHIGSLLGLNVTAKKGQATDLKGNPLIGVILDEAGVLVCLVHFDLAGAGSVGAALSRIPPGAVQDDIKKGALDESLVANFHEVVNVLTVLTTAAVGRRTILRELKHGKDANSAEYKAFATKAASKVYGQLSVQGYPNGNFAFFY